MANDYLVGSDAKYLEDAKKASNMAECVINDMIGLQQNAVHKVNGELKIRSGVNFPEQLLDAFSRVYFEKYLGARGMSLSNVENKQALYRQMQTIFGEDFLTLAYLATNPQVFAAKLGKTMENFQGVLIGGNRQTLENKLGLAG